MEQGEGCYSAMRFLMTLEWNCVYLPIDVVHRWMFELQFSGNRRRSRSAPFRSAPLAMAYGCVRIRTRSGAL